MVNGTKYSVQYLVESCRRGAEDEWNGEDARVESRVKHGSTESGL